MPMDNTKREPLSGEVADEVLICNVGAPINEGGELEISNGTTKTKKILNKPECIIIKCGPTLTKEEFEKLTSQAKAQRKAKTQDQLGQE